MSQLQGFLIWVEERRRKNLLRQQGYVWDEVVDEIKRRVEGYKSGTREDCLLVRRLKEYAAIKRTDEDYDVMGHEVADDIDKLLKNIGGVLNEKPCGTKKMY